MNTQWKMERAKTQMTLGKLIDELKAMPKEANVANLCLPHSYRGYYSDLAFELFDGTRKAKDLLDECIESMGERFDGYKGGEFLMERNTPVWVAEWGCTGKRLMRISCDGLIDLQEEKN